ncbi:MAG: polysaccharide biosynthesis protein [Sphingobacteriales bacterium]|nr:MAG: polysaccharide biosynthesis protein [Sphingobacteriales bacterium]
MLGIDRTVQNTVGHEAFGIYQALLNVTILFQIVLDFGLQAYNTRVLTKSPKAMSNLFPNLVAIKLLFALVYAGVTLSFGAILGYSSQSFLLLATLCLMQIAASLLLFFRSNISALQHFKTDSIFSVTDRIIAIGILGFLLFSTFKTMHPFRIEWYAEVQAIAMLISAAVAFYVCTKLGRINWGYINFKKIWIIIKQSMPYAITIFLMAMYLRVDVIMLEKISADPSLTGKFAASFRVLEVSNNMTGALIAGLLFPMYAKMIAAKEDYKSLVRLVTKLLIPFSLVVMVTCCFWSLDVLNLLKYKDINQNDGIILFWLIATFPLHCINYIYSTALSANGNIRIILYISLAALILNIGLNYFMLQPENPLNAVIVARNAFITLSVVTVLTLYFCKRYLDLSISNKTFLQFSVFLFLLIGIGFLVHQYAPNLHILYKSLVMSLAALVLFFILGIQPIRTLKAQVKKYFRTG